MLANRYLGRVDQCTRAARPDDSPLTVAHEEPRARPGRQEAKPNVAQHDQGTYGTEVLEVFPYRLRLAAGADPKSRRQISVHSHRHQVAESERSHSASAPGATRRRQKRTISPTHLIKNMRSDRRNVSSTPHPATAFRLTDAQAMEEKSSDLLGQILGPRAREAVQDLLRHARLRQHQERDVPLRGFRK
jgi:hypothetical protein